MDKSAILDCRSQHDRAEFRGMMKENREAANGVPADMKEPVSCSLPSNKSVLPSKHAELQSRDIKFGFCPQVDEDAARHQLFQSKASAKETAKARRSRNSAYDIGKDLEGTFSSACTCQRLRLQPQVRGKVF